MRYTVIMEKNYFLGSLLFFYVFTANAQSNGLFQIPEMDIYASEILPNIDEDTVVKQSSFQTSQLITLHQYKQFLAFLKTEYDDKKSNQYLPDSSITSNLEDYNKYLQDTIYEKYPVLGLSWENAMAYCIWKSREDQLEDENLYYRLPNFTEYAAIRKYDSIHPNENLVKDDYSEWSIVSEDESFYSFSQASTISLSSLLNYVYFAESEDHPSMKRKNIFGNNFHFKRNNLFFNEWYSMYQDKGYRFVGFRLIVANTNVDSNSNMHELIYDLYDYQ